MIRRLARALLRRCPRCGSSGIFEGWWRLRDTCPSCDLRYEREEGYWLGAVAINTGFAIIGFAAVFVGLIVVTWPSPPWGLVGAVTVIANLALPIVMYPISKTVWVAIDLTMRGEPNVHA